MVEGLRRGGNWGAFNGLIQSRSHASVYVDTLLYA
jgi:hypothetical protein